MKTKLTLLFSALGIICLTVSFVLVINERWLSMFILITLAYGCWIGILLIKDKK